MEKNGKRILLNSSASFLLVQVQVLSSVLQNISDVGYYYRNI